MINFEYQLYKSNRKTISVEIGKDAVVIVRAPLRMSKRDIDNFLESKQRWIETHLLSVKERLSNMPAILTEDERKDLIKQAKIEIPKLTSFYAKLMGVEYGRITIRAQKTRFGSCSSKKNLNFNLAIMLMPDEIRDYVIVHELAHLKEMNHSSRFWREIEKIIPDYNPKRKWLQDNGFVFIHRIT